MSSINYTVKPTIAPNLPTAQTEYSVDYEIQLTNALRLYFNQLDNFTQNAAKPASGTTAHRPNFNLPIGATYFDTTLGIPIWYNGSHWVNSSGTIV